MDSDAPRAGGFNVLGHDLFDDPILPEGQGALAERFIVPPFSVISAREGDWQARKRAWLSLGIRGELGRADELTYAGHAKKFDYYRVKQGTRQTTDEQGTSAFDPVLCELMYTWFCPPGGQIVDPFAGGSVRGIVAHKLGYRYWGCDLRAEQIAANEEQARDIMPDGSPAWVCADALDALLVAPQADFVFSCPPYGDLEKYSDNPRDLSNMEYHTFLATYKRIIKRACGRLRADRFACFVVGDFRDKRTGHYRNFVSDTIAAFAEQRLGLYNEAVFVTAVGSLPIRVGKQFDSGRKLGKTHQNILVFVKGDWRRAAKAVAQIIS